jgi:pimeloyl-ACP methyl ester carboxylesterase
MKDFRMDISRLSTQRYRWIVGEKDSKFLSLAEGLSETVSLFPLEVIPKQGHRLLHSSPELILEQLKKLL